MIESVQSQGGPASASAVRQLLERQRELLTDQLTVSMFKAARRLAPLLGIRHALETLLLDEIGHMRYCRGLYVLDAGGSQVSGYISRAGVDRSQYARDRAGSVYLQHIIGVSDFRLSNIYFSTERRRLAVTAIQVMRDRNLSRVGFLGADFDLCELPHWHEYRDEPALGEILFGRQRNTSVIDRRLNDVLGLLQTLICERGVFHGKLHFSNNQAVVWLSDDPFRYRLLRLDALLHPDTGIAFPRRPYPDTARVPAAQVRPVLERLRLLRQADGDGQLRSGSLNIYNGMVCLDFACAGSHYLEFGEFLEADAQSCPGLRCAV